MALPTAVRRTGMLRTGDQAMAHPGTLMAVLLAIPRNRTVAHRTTTEVPTGATTAEARRKPKMTWISTRCLRRSLLLHPPTVLFSGLEELLKGLELGLHQPVVTARRICTQRYIAVPPWKDCWTGMV